ncbi:hypothetical protein [Cellulophaga sp. BC115SP]|uniref:hypothetical protein n=1 Tax=Cellulophaga sp. BC115SP TaxID=2683263 RepID=UPI0014128F93|nr:hypothetical protein [Cellulophaga sp. BC115SP]NBB28207.1 hypothetical protein [Cellulophaga sp. BC115SP]
MQVKIDNNCFLNSQNFDSLDEILDFFISGRHTWLGMDLESIEQTEWYKELGTRDIKSLEKLFQRSIRPSSTKKTINISENASDSFNTFEAQLYLNQPLTIIVENYEYEPVFINCIFKNFANELIEAKDNHWLKFENGGGGSDNTVNGMLKEMFNHPQLTKNKEDYLRCYVIKDSDREYCIVNNDGTISLPSLPKSKTQYLEKRNIAYHILFKREKENYMPKSVFNSMLHKRDKKDFIKAYIKLEPYQMDFFDLEEGFSSKGKLRDRASLKPEIKNLYANLSDDLFRRIGLGLPFPNFKSNFSSNFEHVGRKDLEEIIRHQPLFKSKVNNRDSTERNEFEHIIHEINYLL